MYQRAGVDRNIMMLGFVSFFVDFSTAMITPLLPIYVVEVLHATYFQVGLMVAVASAVTYATRLLSGYLSDRYRIYKPLVVGGYLLSSLAKPLFAFAGTWIHAAALQTVERLGKGVREAPKDTLISAYVRDHGHGRSFGFHKMLDTLGSFSGALTLFIILYVFGQGEEVMRGIFLATGFFGAIGVFLVWRYVADVPPSQRSSGHLRLGTVRREVAVPILLFAGFSLFIFTDAFFILRAKDVGFETGTVPLLFMLFTLVQATVSYPLGRLIDRYGTETILALSYLAGIVSILLLMVGTPAAVWSGFAAFGFYTVGSLNAVRSLISLHTVNKSVAYGVLYTLLALALFISASVIGAVWESYGAEAALLLSFGGSCVFALVQLLYTVYRKAENKR